MRPGEVLRDESDLLIVAVQEVAAAVGPIVAELAEARARFMVAQTIEDRDLVVRASQEGQPTAFEVLRAVLEELERHATKPPSEGATAAGAYNIARRVGVRMGVYDAERLPGLTRTRGEVIEAPNPRRKREGARRWR